jgi:hypothetical protein
MSALDWVQLNPYGVVVGKFRGTFTELRSHIERELVDVAHTVMTEDGSIYLPDFGRTVNCPMLTMNTPWGMYRFIPASYAHR